MADVAPINVPPVEAIQYFRRKGYRISWAWQDVYAEEHARAFTVAKAMSLDLLEDIRAAVDQAIAEGITLQEFRRRLEPTLRAKGWWGRQRTTDPLTGEEREVQLGSPRRLATIYNVNLRTAYAAGRWDQIQRTKDRRPYLRYVAILDGRTRPQHRAWHGTVLPADHPWWQTHYPPNGWNCRCTVQQLSERDLERFGYTVSESPPDTGLTRTWTNPRTGEIRRVPLGIDPGWDYNPGIAGVVHSRRHLIEKLEAAAAADFALASAAVHDLVSSEDLERFLREPAGDYPMMVVPDAVRDALGARARVARLSAETARKNLRNHPDLTTADYRLAPIIAESPTLVVQDSDRTAVFVHRIIAGTSLYWAVIKVTTERDEIYLTSLRRTNMADVRALLRRAGAKVLIGEAGDVVG